MWRLRSSLKHRDEAELFKPFGMEAIFGALAFAPARADDGNGIPFPPIAKMGDFTAAVENSIARRPRCLEPRFLTVHCEFLLLEAI
jgi:hypothetical protein